MRTRRATNAAAATATFALVMMTMPSAEALTEWASCPAGGDLLTSGATYTNNNTQWYVSKEINTITGNTASENNLDIQIWNINNLHVYFAWSSSSIKGGKTYYQDPDIDVPKGGSVQNHVHAIMDQNGPDPSCNANFIYDGVDQP